MLTSSTSTTWQSSSSRGNFEQRPQAPAVIGRAVAHRDVPSMEGAQGQFVSKDDNRGAVRAGACGRCSKFPLLLLDCHVVLVEEVSIQPPTYLHSDRNVGMPRGASRGTPAVSIHPQTSTSVGSFQQRPQAPAVIGRAVAHRDVPSMEGAQGQFVSKDDNRGAVRGKRGLSEMVQSRPTTLVTKYETSDRNVVVQANYYRVLKTEIVLSSISSGPQPGCGLDTPASRLFSAS
uniref:Uncharacterized protein n=1 Tax=Glossina austeni TaxID=7395 RepID=A0A1A9V3Z4_GLOAU